MTPKPTKWWHKRETTSVWGIRVLCSIYYVLGYRVFQLCTFPVVLVHFLINTKARHVSQQYLQRLQEHFHVFKTRPGLWHSFKHFKCFAETLLDKILAYGGKFPWDRISINSNMVLGLHHKGKGAVILTAHIGCMELCRAVATKVPTCRLCVLVHTEHAQQFNKILDSLQDSAHIELIEIKSIDMGVAGVLSNKLAQGHFIVIAGDRVPPTGGRTIEVDFLGHKAPFPIGPYILASALHCAILMMSCTHRGRGYALDFEMLSEQYHLPRLDRQAALTQSVQAFAHWMESKLTHSPYDWFNFFDFWDQHQHANTQS